MKTSPWAWWWLQILSRRASRIPLERLADPNRCPSCGCDMDPFGPDDRRSHERYCASGPRARGLWPPSELPSLTMPVGRRWPDDYPR